MKNINNSENRINVDSSNYSFLANYKQEDDAVLTIDLFRNGIEFDVTGQEVSLAAIREDKIIIEQLEGFSINKNKVTIEFKNNILEVPGTVLCELNFIDSQGSMTTTDFKIKVNKKILTVDAISANDLETINKIKQEELKRQKNETERNLNEETRKTQEEDRKINDKARQSQEVARQEAELLRETQESTRQENELLREEIFNNSQQERDRKFIDAQNDRENTFNLNERERKNTFTSNEQDRTNVFNTNELTRNEKEETRKSQENERVNAENIRKSNEEIRTSNEIDRENRFDIVETNANSLIDEMQNTIDSNIGTEVIEARKGKDKLGLRLDDMEQQSVENTSSIEGILQELLNCIKSDGSVAMTGNLKVVAIERTATGATNELGLKTTTGETIYFGKTEKMVNNAFRLSSACKGKVDLGAPTFPWKDIWVGSYAKSENGYCKLTNGLILQWGKASIEPGYSSGAGYFPIAFPEKCFFVVANPWITQGYNYSISSPLGLLIKDNTHFTSQTWEVNNGKVEYTWFAIGH